MRLFFIILLISFGIITTSEITGIYFIYESKLALQNSILSDAADQDRMLVNRIDNYMSERTMNIFDLTNDKSVLQAIVASNVDFQKMDNPRQYIEAQNVTWNSIPQNMSTKVMSSIVENPTSDRIRNMLNMEKKIYHENVFDRILLANSFGADVAGSIRPDDYDQFTDPLFVSAKQNGIYIGNATLDHASGLVGIPIAVRINDENGNFVGVAKGVVDISNIFNIISDQMSTQTVKPTEYELFDMRGTVLYSTDRSETPFVTLYQSDFMKNMRSQSGSFVYVDPEDGQHFIAYASSSSSKISPSANWIIATEYDPNQILKPVVDLTNLLILIMFVIVPITCVIIFVISKRIEKPLKNLATSMDGFSHGSLEHVESKGSEETQNLANGYNRMLDIVNQKQKTVYESQQKLHALFEYSPIAIMLVNEDLKITNVNKRFLELFGYQNFEDVISKKVKDFVADDSLNQYDEMTARHAGKAELYNIKSSLKKKDDSVITSLINVKSVYGENGKFIADVVTIKDISQIEQAQQKILEEERMISQSEKLYKTLFESSPGAIIFTDENYRINTINSRACEMFDYSADELRGKSVSMIVSDKDLRKFEEFVGSTKDRALDIRFLSKRKDGTEFPSFVSVLKLYDDNQSFIGALGIIQDISELEKVKSQILEKEQKISNQYKELVKVEKLKDEFSSMITHELSTPLFPIKFHAAMLKDPKNFGTLNEDQLNSVNEIYQNSERLEKLISDVLDVQKLEMRVLRFKKRIFKIDAFMDNVFAIHLPYMKNKQIKFINSSKGQFEITSDAERLNQVFNNLIINSVDFVSENVGVIEINAKEEGNDAVFYVKDNGTGIPKGKQGDLFKKFYQIDTSPTRKHRGSGLGLSICKGIVEGLGGKIWLESTEGIGTVVYFRIPKSSKTG